MRTISVTVDTQYFCKQPNRHLLLAPPPAIQNHASILTAVAVGRTLIFVLVCTFVLGLTLWRWGKGQRPKATVTSRSRWCTMRSALPCLAARLTPRSIAMRLTPVTVARKHSFACVLAARCGGAQSVCVCGVCFLCKPPYGSHHTCVYYGCCKPFPTARV